MEGIVINATLAVRSVVKDGRTYLVAPMTMIVPGVLHGSNGPLLYPPDEVARSVDAWNGMPITNGHPKVSGQYVSGRSPGVTQLGSVFNARLRDRDRALQAEAWFDEEVTRTSAPDVHQRLVARLPVGLSTGLFTTNEPAPPGSVWNGLKAYTAVARNHRPDHLAILVSEPGACSLADGCGVLVNEAGQTLVTVNSNPKGCNQHTGPGCSLRPGPDASGRHPSRHNPAITYGNADDRNADDDAADRQIKKAANKVNKLKAQIAASDQAHADRVAAIHAAAAEIMRGHDDAVAKAQARLAAARAAAAESSARLAALKAKPPKGKRRGKTLNHSSPDPEPTVNQSHGDDAMKLTADQRKKIVGDLVTNCGCQNATGATPWKGKPEAELNAMTDNELLAFDAARQAIANTAAVPDGFTDGQGNQHRYDRNTNSWITIPALRGPNPPVIGNGAAPAAPAPTQTGPLTAEQWLASMPPEMRPVWNSAVEVHDREKGAIIAQLVANVADGADKTNAVASLQRLDVATLRTLTPLGRPTAQPTNNGGAIFPNWFGGNGLPSGNGLAAPTPVVNEAPLPTPKLDFAPPGRR